VQQQVHDGAVVVLHRRHQRRAILPEGGGGQREAECLFRVGRESLLVQVVEPPPLLLVELVEEGSETKREAARVSRKFIEQGPNGARRMSHRLLRPAT
jgi:hypothetical protein